MKALAGQLYAQAPNRMPRNIEIIMKKAQEQFRLDACNHNEYYNLRLDTDKAYDYFKKLLESIPEFRDLNLSQIEYDNHISVDDENRAKYSFSSAYDKNDSESWKNDFIDLDAFYRNFYNLILYLNKEDDDCFLCSHQGKNDDKCSTCIRNPEICNDNFDYPRTPKGEYTFACRYDCFIDRYICCEECNDKNVCSNKCSSSSDKCNNALYKNNNKKEGVDKQCQN